MFAKSKWILAVALVAVLMVSGVAFALGDDLDSAESNDIHITIEEVAQLEIMGTSQSLIPTFTVGLQTQTSGVMPKLDVTTDTVKETIEIGYASILPAEGGTRKIIASLNNDAPGGLTLTATASDLGGGPGVYGEKVENPTALSANGDKSSSPVVLITGIGSVSEAKAKVTYTLEITNVEDLAAIEKPELEVTLTLTAAEYL